jgi:hypothetical protein
MEDLLFAVGEAEQVEGVADHGEDDGHRGQEALQLVGLGLVPADLRSDSPDSSAESASSRQFPSE